MAIAPPPKEAWNRREAQGHIVDPLNRLRGTIRLYVILEALSVFGLGLALWFWVGILLDYGVFRLFALDWVQDAPRWVRVAILALLGGGLAAFLAVTMVGRLIRRFRDSAVALVLERRFPDLLGDRLITAVELADPKIAETYGFSEAMIDQTIRDAAERVARVPVKDVFDWARLKRRGLILAALTLGAYVVTAAGYCVFVRAEPVRFVRWFNDVAAIWFERNILLTDTIWPRQAFLVFLNPEFAYGNEIRVGRDAPAPTIRVQAIKWVIADTNRRRAPEGWRPLLLEDLYHHKLGPSVDPERFWKGWENAKGPYPTRAVDELERQYDKPEVRGSMPADEVLAVRSLLEELHSIAASPGMRRRFRELDIPASVTLYSRGETSRSEQTMQRQVDNLYSGAPDIRESEVRFTVRGDDYYTPWKRIFVVPPPSIYELTIDEAQPAYLYHRKPIDGTDADLRGRKQLLTNRPISLTGDTSRIEVPTGTDLVLTAKTDKPLRAKDGVSLVPGQKGNAQTLPPVHQLDAKTFQVKIAALAAPLDFILQLTDTGGVTGSRHITIRPAEDAPPDVDVQVEVVRRTPQGFLVTASALVPFSGKVRDDRGLTRVDYRYTVARADLSPAVDGRLGAALGLVGAVPVGPDATLSSLVRLVTSDWLGGSEERKTPQISALATFEQALRERSRNDLPLDKLIAALSEPPAETMFKEFNLDPETESFAVEKLGLKTDEEKGLPPRYRMRLWVAATDKNIETGPGTGQSKEVFTFLIVSENELLAEIAKEEEGLRTKLVEAVDRLRDSRVKLGKVIEDLPAAVPDELSPMARRAEELTDAIVKSWDACREILTDYQRILKELRVNRVQVGMITKVNEKICEPLDGAINLEFVQADESMRDLQKKLDAKEKDLQAPDLARQRLDKLISRLDGVLEAMQDVTTVNTLIQMLIKIEKGENEEFIKMQKLLKQKEAEVLEGLEPKKRDK